jgi:hypothetical protein
MSATPMRRSDELDAQFVDEDARVRQLDEKLRQLTDDSAARIHDFERRLEHEWLALRQLHEEELKRLRERAAALEKDRPPVAAPPGTFGPVAIVLTATLLALTGLGGYTLWRQGADLRTANARAATAEREVNETFQGLKAPAADWQEFILVGQQAAPGASGRVLWSRSRLVVVSASGLPDIAPNQQYRVWVMTPLGTTTLGILSPDPQGRATKGFEVDGNPSAENLGFSITVEPQDGSLVPEGVVVLASPRS